MRNVNVDIYEVVKPITINTDAICKVGDILMIDESAYDGASVMNLTQGWGFQCFGQYESVKLLAKKTYSWNEYMRIYRGEQKLNL